MKVLKVIVFVCVLLVVGWFGLNFLAFGRFAPPTNARFEAMARSGQPIVQAINDYRNEHRLLPNRLEDLVPKYLPKQPDREWRYYRHSLTRSTGYRHIYVYALFDLAGDFQGWHRKIDSSHKLLGLPGPTNSLTGEALFAARLAEYERHENESPDNQKDPELIGYTLKFLRSQKRWDLLRKKCEDVTRRLPNWCLPEALLAEANMSDTNVIGRFPDWARERGTYAAYWYLARYYRENENTLAALEALEKASACAFQRDRDERDRVAPALAFSAVRFAYENKNYELTLKLCRQWENAYSSDKDEQSWLAFQAAAELGMERFDPAIAHAKQMVNASPHNSMWAKNVYDLLRAAEAHDRAYQYRTADVSFDW